MHDLSTRAWPYRRRSAALATAFLAAALVSGPAQAASSDDPGDSTASIARAGAAHAIRIEFVKAGREGLELSARLTEDGGTIMRPISWKVRKAGGETVFEGDTPIADMATEPGDYRVEIGYGSVRLAQSVALLANQRLGVSFVLDIGGIRVLPRIVKLGLPLTRTETRIFAASGHLVAQSRQPGEIVRVAAGSYRIESRFEPGNTLAIAGIKVKPGMMSAVEIDHDAGLARLRLAKATDDKAAWTIVPAQGAPLSIGANAADVVLKPGDYTAHVSSGAQEFETRFSISAGETRMITLGD